MKKLLLFLLCLSCATKPTPQQDTYLWLENIDDPRALAWVASQTGFEERRQQALAALSSESRVPQVSYHGSDLYSVWKDGQHPRGIYRRTTLDQLRTPNPQWTTVLDIDELSRREGKQWVFKGMECLEPDEKKCVVSLSPGGGDAVEIREFDPQALKFVDNGFFIPVAKTDIEWIDANTLLVATDFGPDSLTASGYPRIVKRWTRGTPLSSAKPIYEAAKTSVRVRPSRIRTADTNIDLIEESTTFWSSKYFRVSGDTLTPLDIPETATIAGGSDGKLVLVLQEKWGELPAGSVVTVGVHGEKRLIAAPTASSIIDTSGVEATDNGILVPMLENVRARLRVYGTDGSSTNVPFPDNGALEIMTVDDDSGDALVKFETFTDPPALYYVSHGHSEKILAQRPTFDGSQFETTQQWATSKDGTRIPYFIVGRKGFKRDGSNPTHIFSYGGFRSSLTPSYSGSYEQHYGAYGKLWLEPGGIFVLANIRGGGEFGPEWHNSVLKENRHKVLEDFEAVAEDLIRTHITSSKHLGIEGRSNGGLLTLSELARRPDLYGAVIAGSPLSDMQRYKLLLAGASWEAEYGDVTFSPYQAFRKGMKYPPLFVYASTRDDRVHPGHARKTVAKLQDLGYPVWYYENVEGGHGASSTNEQTAYRIALSYTHLWRWLR